MSDAKDVRASLLFVVVTFFVVFVLSTSFVHAANASSILDSSDKTVQVCVDNNGFGTFAGWGYSFKKCPHGGSIFTIFGFPFGSDGDKGPTGDKGPAGDKGPVGDKGPTGDQGPAGVQGQPGVQGAPGEQGVKGMSGDQGLTGATGPQGAVGDKGPIGDKGASGDQGVIGDKGPAGDQGVSGDKGPVGDKGSVGDAGPQGKQGPDGDQGLPGDPGMTGDKGQTGEKGPAGDKGAVGDQGAVGDKGPTGDKGPSGVNAVHVIEGSTQSVSTVAGTEGTFNASCDATQVLVGGGAHITQGTDSKAVISSSLPSVSGLAGTWRVDTLTTAGGDTGATIAVYAMCIDQ